MLQDIYATIADIHEASEITEGQIQAFKSGQYDDMMSNDNIKTIIKGLEQELESYVRLLGRLEQQLKRQEKKEINF